MADSIPRLKADINALQGKLTKALARIAELESAPPVVIEKPVPMPAEKPVIDRRAADTQVVYVEREKPVAMPADRIVEYRDRVKNVTVISDKQDKAKDRVILELQAEIIDLRAKLSAEKRKKRKTEIKTEYVKVPVDVERIVYKDNPAKDKEIKRLTDALTDCQLDLMRERQKPPVVEYVDRIVEKPVIEYVTKVEKVEVLGPERIIYKDNPEHIAMIRKLQGKADGDIL